MLENAGKDVLKIGLLAASPAIGNLSTKLRERIEQKVGEDCYNPVVSGMISSVSNVLIYPLTIFSLTNNKWLTAASLFYTLSERVIRDKIYDETRLDFREYPASLPGKIISFPIEYITNLYDRAKKQMEK